MADVKPLVSLLMTTYNREKYIAEAIESAMECEYNNFELIIVDDCSTDNSYNIADHYSKTYKNIKLFKNEKNLGQFTNRNKAASYASGHYIMYVDSDDRLYKGVVSKCVDAMQQFPNDNFGMYYNDSTLTEAFFWDAETAFRKNYFEKHFLGIGPGSTILKKSFFNEIGGYTDKYAAVGDMYFNLKACLVTGIILMPWDFVYYRRHDGQEINNPYSYLYNTYRYLNDALRELDMPLNKDQKEWINKKNKRRFVTNIYNYFIRTRNIKLTYKAIKMAEFRIPDFFKAIFHK